MLHFSKTSIFLVLAIALFLPHFAHASVFQAYDVLGQQNASNQPDFTTNNQDNYLGSASTTNAQGLNYPFGLAVDKTNHRLFVADCVNKRVLEYDLDTNNNPLDHTADHVIGQSNFNSAIATTTSAGISNCTEGLSYDTANNFLFVGEGGGDRILVYDLSSGITNSMNASYVIGQADFTSKVSTTTASGIYAMAAFDYDSINKLLFVSDNVNRFLIYDLSSGITNGMAASYVLGHSDFTSTTATTTQSGMDTPYAIAHDSVHKRIFVDDEGNNRVLVYDLSSGITDGMSASYVIGQSNFASSSRLLTQTSVGLPEVLSYDALNNRLFVGDENNNRILIFDLSSGITNGMSASSVIGATDFTTAGSGIATQHDINDPELGMDYDETTNKLFMTDNSNNRVLIWKFIKISTASLTDGIVGSPYSQTLTSTSSQGTVSWSLASGTLPAGLTLATTTGIISGTPTTAGSYTFILKAQDYLSDPQTFTDSKSFTLNTAAAPASAPAPSTSGFHGQSGGGGSASAQSSSVAASIISPLTTAVPLPGCTLLCNASPDSISAPPPAAIAVTLSPSSKSPNVVSLQSFLISQGFLNATPTGFYGALTTAAVKAFQRAHGIVSSGTPSTTGYGAVGPKTRALMNALIKANATAAAAAPTQPALPGAYPTVDSLLRQIVDLQNAIAKIMGH